MRKHSDLRSLSLAYYWGWIPREKYLGLRREFLKSITEGKKPRPIKPRELAPPKKDSIPTNTTSGSGNKTTIILSAAIVLIIVGLVYYFTPSDKDTESENKQPAGVKKTDSVQAAQKQTSTQESQFSAFLNATFIQKSNWGPDALNVLKFKWQGLSQEQQSTIRETRIFDNFSRTLISKIMEERSLNNIVPSDKELTLMTAARDMGLLEQLPAE